MTTDWQKSEQRDVRPFFEVDGIVDALRGTEMRAFDDGSFAQDESYSLRDDDSARVKPVLRIRLPLGTAQKCRDLGLKTQLLVTASNPFLKRSDVVWRSDVTDSPDDVAVPAETIDDLGGGSNLIITVALCLAVASKQKIGLPFLPGHWLAQKTFTLRLASPSSDFDIQPLTDDEWKARGFPGKTAYLAEYIGFINEPLAPDQPIAHIYVHADLYRKIAADAADATRGIQRFLAAEITTQLLVASSDDWENAEAIVARSPLSSFVKAINRHRKCDLHELSRLVKEPGQPRLRALLHADQGTVRSVVES